MNEKETAIAIARQAGEILFKGWQSHGLGVYEKGSAINPVTEIDRQSDALIKRRLLEAFPSYGILSEESDEVQARQAARWIVDPLDGTTNFIRRYPFVAVSIALEVGGSLVLGVVFNPILDELFVGQRGEGSYLNGIPITASSTSELGSSLLASGFPYDAWENSDNNNTEWGRFLRMTRSLRCDGSAALDLCRVASGQLDGYWEKGIFAWDMAAGVVIAREAGAIVSDYQGEDHFLATGQVIAANPALHAKILQAIHQ